MPAMPAIATRTARTYQVGIDLVAVRRALEEQRRFRLDQLASLGVPARVGQGRPAETEEASADDARAEVEAVIAAAARRALDDVDAALERLHTGRYGRCERCSEPIDAERLAILPQASLCMRCQRITERRH